MDKVRFSETGYKDYTRPYKVGGAARQYRGWQVDILFTLSIFCLGCFFLNKPRKFPHTMLVARLIAALTIVLTFNLHYVCLGRPFLEGPLTSRPVLAVGNRVVGKLVRLMMSKQGVPQPDRTETYCNGRIDIFEPDSGSTASPNEPHTVIEPDSGSTASPSEPRTAVIYFHSGAFIAGDRAFGAGMCGFLASHGVLCMSASYRLTNSGAGVAGCVEDAWAVLRWTRANAGRLNIDPAKIVVAGDSAGGLLATALGTGLGADVPTGMGGFNAVGRAELPAAVIGNWPATALGSRTYVPKRDEHGGWEATAAGKDFLVPNAFVPSRYMAHTHKWRLRLHGTHLRSRPHACPARAPLCPPGAGTAAVPSRRKSDSGWCSRGGFSSSVGRWAACCPRAAAILSTTAPLSRPSDVRPGQSCLQCCF